MKILTSIGAVLAIVAFATQSQAAIFHYRLDDHPDGNASSSYDYGLKLAAKNRYFTFDVDNGANVGLIYDDVAQTATIFGTAKESTGIGTTTSSSWTLNYVLTNVADLGGGLFKAWNGTNGNPLATGSGSITDGATTIALGAKARNDGLYFSLNTGQRNFGGITGEGWVNYPDDLNPQGDNDFLFTAFIDPSGTAGVVPEPTTLVILASGFPMLLLRSRRR